MLSFITVKN